MPVSGQVWKKIGTTTQPFSWKTDSSVVEPPGKTLFIKSDCKHFQWFRTGTCKYVKSEIEDAQETQRIRQLSLKMKQEHQERMALQGKHHEERMQLLQRKIDEKKLSPRNRES